MTGLLELDGSDDAAPSNTMSAATATMDGLIAGVALCPATIPTDEWIRFAFGGRASDDAGNGLFGMLRATMGPRMRGFVDKAVDRMHAGRYVPMHGGDSAMGLAATSWSFWIVGFGRMLALRPAAWEAYDAVPATREALADLRAVRDLELGLRTATTADMARLEIEAPSRIDRAVAALVASRLGAPLRARQSTVARLAGPLIGRNAPCPCGSGKKYKHCCGR